MASPHRAADVHELCDVCRAKTDNSCIRCGLPLCAEHLPSRRGLCGDCDTLFLQVRDEQKHEPGLLGVLGVIVGASAATTAILVAGLQLFTGLLAVVTVALGVVTPVAFGRLAIPPMLRRREKKILHAFLDDSRYRGLLPAANRELSFSEPPADD